MSILNKRTLNLALVFTLLLSLILPSVSLAETDTNKGSLTIHKYQQEKGDAEGTQTGPSVTIPEGSKALPGVTYEVIQTHSFDGKNWKEVAAGASYTEITNDKGKIELTNLALGRYTVQEIDGPDNVILNTNKFSVDIPMTYEDGKKLAYDVNIYPKNEIIRGAVELTKVNEAGDALAGVKFQLYKADGTKEGGELTTKTDGKISVKGLAAGNYYFKEVSTIGNYATNETKIPFEVTKDKDGKDGKVVVNWTEVGGFTKVDSNNPNNIMVTNYNQPDVKKDVEDKNQYNVDRNKEYKYNITIKTPGDIEKYTKLKVTDTLDNRLEFITNGTITDGWEVTGTTKDNVTLTQTGQTLEWSVKDITKLTANTEIKITFTAKIKPDAELTKGETGITNKANLDFDNNRGQASEKETDPVIVTPNEGGVKVIKVDKNGGAKLDGAEFKLTTDKAGENVLNAKGTTIKVNGASFTGKLENLATKNGEILIEGLTPGTYYLHETKAPTYTEDDGTEKSYRLLTKPVEVKVANSTKNEEVRVENSKSGWELPTTGGLGTILFTIIGLALMGIALFAYLRRRKTAEQ